MKRVLTGRFMHETNTFSIQKTDMALWRRRDFHLGNEIPAAFRGTRSALGATFEAADKYGWTLVHPVSANANPSGIVTDDAFEQIGGMMLDAVDGRGRSTACCCTCTARWSSTATRTARANCWRGCAQILGPDVPIVVTLDLHANVTQQMADNASALIAFRTYPHVDQYERAWQGAELLERAMQGEVRPQHRDRPPADDLRARPRPPPGGADGRADRPRRGAGASRRGAGRQHLRRLQPRQYPRCRPVGDGDGRQAPAMRGRTARRSPRNSWTTPGQTRDYESFKLLSVAEAVARAKQGKPGDKPLVVADYTDNPGGGGYGDATAFLKGLVEAGVERVAFHAICDPEAVQPKACAPGSGCRRRSTLGGKTDPRMGGGPLTLTGEVTHLTNGKFIAYGPMGGGVERDYGPSMVFRVGGIDIIVISNNGQAVDLGQFTSLGIDPTRYTHRLRQVDAAFPRRLRADRPRGRPGRHRRPVLGDLHPGLFNKVRRPVWPLDDLA